MKNFKSFFILIGIFVLLIESSFWFGPLFVFADVTPVEDEVPVNEVFVYNDHGARDPLWPLISPKGILLTYDKNLLIMEMTLEGIMLGSDGKNLAIINGRILKMSDEVGEFVISEIKNDMVILMKNHEKFELRLKKEE